LEGVPPHPEEYTDATAAACVSKDVAASMLRDGGFAASSA
jgi:hypothetical protein